MADLPFGPDTGDDTGVRPNQDRPPGMPTWIKASGIVVVGLVLLFVVLSFIGGGHTPPIQH